MLKSKKSANSSTFVDHTKNYSKHAFKWCMWMQFWPLGRNLYKTNFQTFSYPGRKGCYSFQINQQLIHSFLHRELWSLHLPSGGEKHRGIWQTSIKREGDLISTIVNFWNVESQLKSLEIDVSVTNTGWPYINTQHHNNNSPFCLFFIS